MTMKMKKMKLLASALAVTGMMAATEAAHAAADGWVFYGLIDGGMASTSIKGAGGTSRTEFLTGGYAPNFVGMTGQKSLTTGLKGGFQVEQGFLLNNNPCTPACASANSRFWFGPDSIANRQANVYLDGKFGVVRLGTQPNIAFKSVLLAEPRFGSNLGSALAAVDIDGGLGTVDTGALSYTSPSLSGFTLAGSLVSSQRATTTASVTSGYRGTATYAVDNLAATLAYYKNNTNSVPATPDAHGTILGGSYKFSAFTLKGLYVVQKNAPLNSLKTFGIGGAYELAPDWTLDFGVYKSSDSAAAYKQSTLGIGAQYKVMPQLTLYAQYASAKNNDTAAASFNFAGPTIQPGATIAGQTATTLNLGALFSF